LPGLNKRSTHQALDDIKESIEALRYYKENLIHSDTYGEYDYDE
jgi:oligoribonuclease (3'-5' exoribonuclease)